MPSTIKPLPTRSNLFEFIEFIVSPAEKTPLLYGVDVALVKEVIHMPPLNPYPTKHPYILGAFNFRGTPAPLIHLAPCLGVQSPPPSEAQVIVAELTEDIVAGFLIAHAHRIRRIEKEKILPPPPSSLKTAQALPLVTGAVAHENGEFIFLLDFKHLFSDIIPEKTF